MTTLRRELRTSFEETLSKFSDKLTLPERETLADLLADDALSVSGIAKRTDEMPLEWKLGHDQDITQRDIEAAAVEVDAPRMFEKAFGFGALRWDGSKEWRAMRKFVTAIYEQDRNAFGEYVIWRAGDGKYSAMSNKQIRLNPEVFMDTGWAEFEAQKQSQPEQEYTRLL